LVNAAGHGQAVTSPRSVHPPVSPISRVREPAAAAGAPSKAHCQPSPAARQGELTVTAPSRSSAPRIQWKAIGCSSGTSARKRSPGTGAGSAELQLEARMLSAREAAHGRERMAAVLQPANELRAAGVRAIFCWHRRIGVSPHIRIISPPLIDAAALVTAQAMRPSPGSAARPRGQAPRPGPAPGFHLDRFLRILPHALPGRVAAALPVAARANGRCEWGSVLQQGQLSHATGQVDAPPRTSPVKSPYTAPAGLL